MTKNSKTTELANQIVSLMQDHKPEDMPSAEEQQAALLLAFHQLFGLTDLIRTLSCIKQ